MISHFEHSYSYLGDNDLDGCLARYERAGFSVSDRTVRHPAGQLNGFVHFTKSYLEFVSIIDESEFERDASDGDRTFRRTRRPWNLAFVADAPNSIYETLKRDYPDTKPDYVRAPHNPIPGFRHWHFFELPSGALPGVEAFALRYVRETAPKPPAKVTAGLNTIFTISGAIFCAEKPDERANAWLSRLKQVSTKPTTLAGSQVTFGRQVFDWITPDDYERLFGTVRQRVAHPGGEFAAYRLAAEDPELAASMMQNAGFKVQSFSPETCTAIVIDEHCGNAYLIHRGDKASFVS